MIGICFKQHHLSKLKHSKANPQGVNYLNMSGNVPPLTQRQLDEIKTHYQEAEVKFKEQPQRSCSDHGTLLEHIKLLLKHVEFQRKWMDDYVSIPPRYRLTVVISLMC